MKLVDYNHVILYAKHQYVESKSSYNDVRHIIAVRCGLEDESVSRGHVYNVLLSLLLEYSVDKNNTVNTLLKTFGIKKIWSTDVTNDDTAVDELLHPLSYTTVYDKDGNTILNIGEADVKILPKRVHNDD